MVIQPSPDRPMHTIPVDERPPHGPLFSKIFFPIIFNAGILGINTLQICSLPLLLVPFIGKKVFDRIIDYTKDGFGRLLIAITVLFAPTSLHITTTSPPELPNLVERDEQGNMIKINLPDRLIVMANHQAYTDWMWLWILACYSGNASGLTILLKWSLRSVPFVGWGMRFFRFIFMKRNWAADRDRMTKSLTRLGKKPRSTAEEKDHESRKRGESHKVDMNENINGDASVDNDETSKLLSSQSTAKVKRSPLWLLIFPEGTITSDEERAKSLKYAQKEDTEDFVTLLHPRSTGLLFCLRTLLPQVPDLQLLDVTIGYPGVPTGKYPQYYYGLISVFWKSVPPPTVHIHLHLHTNLTSPSCPIPSLITPITPTSDSQATKILNGSESPPALPSEQALATPEEARKFELWLRNIWTEKEKRMLKFGEEQVFEEEKEGKVEIVKIRQLKWYDWIGAMGGGGVGSVAVVALAIWGVVTGAQK